MIPPPAPVVGRLAPSPTGGLHLGHARTFLLAWLSARSSGGRVVLRIEDIDASRVRPEAISGAVEDLRWLGLDWDAGPYVQSERKERYDEALERLKTSDLIYPCTCTRADVLRAASAPHAEDEGPTYPGTCASRSAGDAASLAGRPFSWRFRTAPGTVAWDDLLKGEVVGDPHRRGGDFLVGRSSGEPAYQLAVVCDDLAMGVTQVIRGDDLLPSTPRQILLFRAFGHEPPTFGHVPLVVGPDGKRLAKRDGSVKLAELRARGIEPRRLIGRLAASLGIEAEVEETPGRLVGRFAFANVPATPWVAAVDDLVQSP